VKVEKASVGVRKVSGVYPRFAEALNRGDLDSASACFARTGCLITPDATAVHGRDRIRPLLAQMIVRTTRIRVEASNRIESGDVVLARELWQIQSGESGSTAVRQAAQAVLVLQWIEGVWKVTIAAPWGWDGSRVP
jgi:ketosteroid isomerase-like protein